MIAHRLNSCSMLALAKAVAPQPNFIVYSTIINLAVLWPMGVSSCMLAQSTMAETQHTKLLNIIWLNEHFCLLCL